MKTFNVNNSPRLKNTIIATKVNRHWLCEHISIKNNRKDVHIIKLPPTLKLYIVLNVHMQAHSKYIIKKIDVGEAIKTILP